MNRERRWGIATASTLALLAAGGVWLQQFGMYRAALGQLEKCQSAGEDLLRRIEALERPELKTEEEIGKLEKDITGVRSLIMERPDPDLFFGELTALARGSNVEVQENAFRADRTKPPYKGEMSIVIYGPKADVDAFLRRVWLWRRFPRWKEDAASSNGVVGTLTFYAFPTPAPPSAPQPCPTSLRLPWLPPYAAWLRERHAAALDVQRKVDSRGALKERLFHFEHLSDAVPKLVDVINRLKAEQVKDPLYPR